MAEYGLGNFIYEIDARDGKANFTFRDPDDSDNTAEVSLGKSDFPEGITSADSRQVADVAYAKVSAQLNSVRDARIEKETNEAIAAKRAEDQRIRDEGDEFLNNTSELGDSTPTGNVPEQQPDKLAPPHTPRPDEKDRQKESSGGVFSKKKK